MQPTIVILTYCTNPELAYGSLLVFDTLRVGYPDNDIVVIDNGSHPDIRPQIEAAANKAKCLFIARDQFNFVDHYAWWILNQSDVNSIVFVDPDVVFWKKMVLPVDAGLMSGRLIPQFRRQGVVALPRLHPSHLYFSDLSALRMALSNSQTWGFNAIGQSSAAIDGVTYSWDTCAPIYHKLQSQCVPFGVPQLECYDHIFYGSHLPLLKSLTSTDLPVRIHKSVKDNRVGDIRGVWREQDEYFKRMA